MIDIEKTVTDKTTYRMKGHAENTDVCNGFSTLVCTFIECLKQDKPDLKYDFERREESFRYEDGKEEMYWGEGESNLISYSGTSRFEEFFDIGVSSMRREFPDSFVYKG